MWNRPNKEQQTVGPGSAPDQCASLLPYHRKTQRHISSKRNVRCHAIVISSNILVLRAAPITSVWVQRRRPASPHRPHSHYLHIAPIFHPPRSKQPQTEQLLINAHNLQDLHVSQEPNCLLLESLRAHLYTRVRWQPPQWSAERTHVGSFSRMVRIFSLIGCHEPLQLQNKQHTHWEFLWKTFFFFFFVTHMVSCPNKGQIYRTSGNTISLEKSKEHLRAVCFWTWSAIGIIILWMQIKWVTKLLETGSSLFWLILV